MMVDASSKQATNVGSKHARLRAAYDTIARMEKEGFTPGQIVVALVADHRATFNDRWDGYSLSIAGRRSSTRRPM